MNSVLLGASPSLVGQQVGLDDRPYSFRNTKGQQTSGVTKTTQIVISALLFLVLLAQLSIRVQILDTGYDIESVRTELLHSDTEYRELRMKYAFVSRPSSLGNKAQSDLGLNTTVPQRLRRVGS